MTKVAIIRCEKNENRCPMTSCFNSLGAAQDGFAQYEECTLAGVFTCRCPGDQVTDFAKILKAKGAEAIHLCTCSFATKTEHGWDQAPGGFCAQIEDLAQQIAGATGLPCVLGTAHLPQGYEPKVY